MTRPPQEVASAALQRGIGSPRKCQTNKDVGLPARRPYSFGTSSETQCRAEGLRKPPPAVAWSFKARAKPESTTAAPPARIPPTAVDRLARTRLPARFRRQSFQLLFRFADEQSGR